jgi:class 3 adenylate cyclase
VDPTRSIQAILFTDIVDSTARAAELGDRAWRALLRQHHTLVRQHLEQWDGHEIATAGDGFLATFDQPAEALHAACAIRDGVRELGLEIRGGVHMGEVEWEEENVGGIAVHIGARVAAAAGKGEVLVSSTVRELMSGSGFRWTPAAAAVCCRASSAARPSSSARAPS